MFILAILVRFSLLKKLVLQNSFAWQVHCKIVGLGIQFGTTNYINKPVIAALDLLLWLFMPDSVYGRISHLANNLVEVNS